ncbi:hypothetical protein J1605_014794 [Eschrichtius robustus]|uniref:Uncharacterized protein n=1 Tax=Eschrichtius robustus TaxID=9764 RepID=A0AB34GF00_ESCRO|nr:hypothetical protein J1605_014794 [Eschrichtius robustus]
MFSRGPNRTRRGSGLSRSRRQVTESNLGVSERRVGGRRPLALRRARGEGALLSPLRPQSTGPTHSPISAPPEAPFGLEAPGLGAQHLGGAEAGDAARELGPFSVRRRHRWPPSLPGVSGGVAGGGERSTGGAAPEPHPSQPAASPCPAPTGIWPAWPARTF